MPEPILTHGGGSSLLGESTADVQRAVDKGVAYWCPSDMHECTEPGHTGDGFAHLLPGKSIDDYLACMMDD